MSVIPIVCETVAAGLACGRRTLGGCCARASDAAHAMTKTEITTNETCLVEVILFSPLMRNVARIITPGEKLEVADGVNLQLFTNAVARLILSAQRHCLLLHSRVTF